MLHVPALAESNLTAKNIYVFLLRAWPSRSVREEASAARERNELQRCDRVAPHVAAQYERGYGDRVEEVRPWPEEARRNDRRYDDK